jgi:hypothetical protein
MYFIDSNEEIQKLGELSYNYRVEFLGKFINILEQKYNIKPIYLRNDETCVFYELYNKNYWLSLSCVYYHSLNHSEQPKFLESFIIDINKLHLFDIYVKKYGYENNCKEYIGLNNICDDNIIHSFYQEFNRINQEINQEYKK